MKHIAIKSLILGAIFTPMLTACDENAWNDEYLDGFEKPTITQQETVTYTMTAADIKKMANMSANKAIAAERGESAALEAVGINGFFTADITPEYYAPAWLDSLSAVKGSFNFYLSEKSTIKLNFPTSDALPAELTGIQNGAPYTISETDYQEVWESETDFIEAFAPSKPASKFIPDILAANINGAHFAIVTYNVAGQDPVFNSGSGNDKPSFELSNVIAGLTVSDDCTINGVVTAICKQGYVLTDASGSILVYYGSSFAIGDYAIGQQRTVEGNIGYFGGCLQVSSTGISDELVGTQEYTYPAPMEITGEIFEQFSAERQALKKDEDGGLCIYGEIKGATFTQSGNYINFEVPGADKSKATGSGYQLPQNTIDLLDLGNPVDVRGYVIGCSGAAYVTFLVTEVNGQRPTFAPTVKVPARAVTVSSTEEKSVYSFNGSKWSECKNVYVLTSNDYAQMGARNDLNATNAAAVLPVYIAAKHPYAKEGDTYYIVYNFYTGSETIKNFTSRATYTGTEWSLTTINNDVMQFVRAGRGDGWSNWVYDPSVYIDLPAGKGAESAPFWQACVNWVYEHVDAPVFGSESITSGIGYVTSYGNNDYYCGASAYQCNIDLRPGSARAQVPSVYGDMSDDDIVALVKKHFELEVCPAVLAETYPDAQPGKGVDIYYVLSFVMYNGSSHNEVIRYLVTAPGTFEFVDCTWNEEE